MLEYGRFKYLIYKYFWLIFLFWLGFLYFSVFLRYGLKIKSLVIMLILFFTVFSVYLLEENKLYVKNKKIVLYQYVIGITNFVGIFFFKYGLSPKMILIGFLIGLFLVSFMPLAKYIIRLL